MSAEDSFRIFRERAAAVPMAAAGVLGRSPPLLPPRWVDLPVVTSGVGSSAAPARLLARLLSQRGKPPARFEPLTAFYRDPTIAEGALLVVFSQGLSGNARIALNGVASAAASVLVTSATEKGLAEAGKDAALERLERLRQDGGLVVEHPFEDEFTLLPRLVGPACAIAVAIQLGEALQAPLPPKPELSDVAKALTEAGPSPEDIGAWLNLLRSTPQLLFTGEVGLYAQNLAAKFTEVLFRKPPVCAELFEYAHGLFQSDRSGTGANLVFTEPGEADAAPLRRAEPLLQKAGPFLTVASPFPAPYSLLFYECCLNHALQWFLEIEPIDLIEWPGKGEDASLYQVDRPHSG